MLGDIRRMFQGRHTTPTAACGRRRPTPVLIAARSVRRDANPAALLGTGRRPRPGTEVKKYRRIESRQQTQFGRALTIAVRVSDRFAVSSAREARQGTGIVGNTHSIDVESPLLLLRASSVSMSIHPEGKSRVRSRMRSRPISIRGSFSQRPSRQAHARGLHSSTFQLNLSAVYRIGGARSGYVAHIVGVLGGG
jgi:hypothetical protein